jgi:hypothetical protein
MAADVLDSIAKLINSPPVVLAAGATLAGIIWKFSGVIESLLTEQSRFEIAVWLVSVEPAKKAAKLRELLLRYLQSADNLGNRLPVCYALLAVAAGLYPLIATRTFRFGPGVALLLLAECAVMFVGTFNWIKWQLSAMRLSFEYYDRALERLPPNAPFKGSVIVPIVVVGVYEVGTVGMIMFSFRLALHFTVPDPHRMVEVIRRYLDASFAQKQLMVSTSHVGTDTLIGLWNVPTGAFILLYPMLLILFFTAIAVIVKARDFDRIFSWFNHHFDIEKKPLQAIGSVAAVIIAGVFWTTALVFRLFT